MHLFIELLSLHLFSLTHSLQNGPSVFLHLPIHLCLALFLSLSLPFTMCPFLFLSDPDPSPAADVLIYPVHFQDHDLILGSLPHFFAIFLEELLAYIDLDCLAFLYQAKLAKLLSAKKTVACVYLDINSVCGKVFVYMLYSE